MHIKGGGTGGGGQGALAPPPKKKNPTPKSALFLSEKCPFKVKHALFC